MEDGSQSPNPMKDVRVTIELAQANLLEDASHLNFAILAYFSRGNKATTNIFCASLLESNSSFISSCCNEVLLLKLQNFLFQANGKNITHTFTNIYETDQKLVAEV